MMWESFTCPDVLWLNISMLTSGRMCSTFVVPLEAVAGTRQRASYRATAASVGPVT